MKFEHGPIVATSKVPGGMQAADYFCIVKWSASGLQDRSLMALNAVHLTTRTTGHLQPVSADSADHTWRLRPQPAALLSASDTAPVPSSLSRSSPAAVNVYKRSSPFFTKCL